MKKFIKIFFVFAYLPVYMLSKDILINKGDNCLKIGKYLSIYEDKSKKLTVDEVKNKEFTNLTKNGFISGYSNSVYWFKATIINNADEEELFINDIGTFFNPTKLYFSIDGINFIENIKAAKYASKYLTALMVEVKKGQKLYVLFSVEEKGGFIRAIPKLSTNEEYKLQSENLISYSKLYTIILVMFAGLAFFAYLFFKNRIHYLFFMFFLMNLMLIFVSDFYILISHLLDKHFVNSNLILKILLTVFRIPTIYYKLACIEELLNLKNVKWFKYISWILIVAMSIVHVTFIFNIEFLITFVSAKNLIYTLLNIFYFAVPLFCIRKYKVAKYLAFGFFLNFIYTILFNLEVFTKTIIIPFATNTIGLILLIAAQTIVFGISFLFVQSMSLKSQKSLTKSVDNFKKALEMGRDPKKLFCFLLQKLKSNLKYDKAFIYLYDKEKNKYFQLLIESNISKIEVNLQTFLDNNKWDKVEIINSIPNDTRFKNREELTGIESMIILPISDDAKYYGVILVTSRYKNMYTEDSINYAINLAYEAAVILNLMDKMKKEIELGIVKQEVEVEKSTKKFAISSIREIIGPVNAANYFLDKVAEDYKKENKVANKGLLEDLASAKEAIKEIWEYTEMSMAVVGEEEKSEFRMSMLNELINDIQENCNSAGVSLKLNLNVPNDTVLFGPKIGLRTTIQEMLQNAVDAFDNYEMQGRTKEIKVTTEIREGKLYIEIYDNGKGIKEENWVKIFGRCSEGKRFGMGVGLMYAKSVIDSLNSRINLESEEGKFTKFSFLIDVLKKL